MSSQNGVSVRPVAGNSEFRKFVGYPYERNRGDLHWVPPLRLGESERLRPKKNPFFAHADVQLLLAFRDGRIVGRIAAIDDHLHNETHRDNVAAFGFFEAEDGEAARALLERVEQWAKQRGRSAVRGPLNPSLNESAGLLIEGFDTDPMLLMPHNPPEYAAFIERAGYAKVKDLYAWLYDLQRRVGPDIEKMAERVRSKHRMVVRPFDLTQFERTDHHAVLASDALRHFLDVRPDAPLQVVQPRVEILDLRVAGALDEGGVLRRVVGHEQHRVGVEAFDQQAGAFVERRIQRAADGGAAALLCPLLHAVEQQTGGVAVLGFKEPERGEVVAMGSVVEVIVDCRNASDDPAVAEGQQQLDLGMGEERILLRR